MKGAIPPLSATHKPLRHEYGQFSLTLISDVILGPILLLSAVYIINYRSHYNALITHKTSVWN